MMRKSLMILAVIIIAGCARTNTRFIAVGEVKYAAKPSDSTIDVYLGDDAPDREYRVIGLVYTLVEPNTQVVLDKKIITLLQNEARKRGADAIVEVRIGRSGGEYNPDYRYHVPEEASGFAKAIIYKKNAVPNGK